jgi:hypothetical protein
MSEQIEKDYNNSGKKIFYPKLNLTYMYVKLWSLNITKIKLLSISKNFFGLCRWMDGPTKNMFTSINRLKQQISNTKYRWIINFI